MREYPTVLFMMGLIAFMGGQTVFAQVDDVFTDINVIELEPGVMCYIGSHYVVRVDDRSPEQEIAVIQQNRLQDDKCTVDLSQSVISFDPIDDPRSVVELRGRYLIVDSGCCPGSRGLEVYNLDQREQLYEGSYWSIEPISWYDSTKISFWVGVKGKKEDCHEADEYESADGSYGFEQLVFFNLEEKALIRNDYIKCSFRM